MEHKNVNTQCDAARIELFIKASKPTVIIIIVIDQGQEIIKVNNNIIITIL